jgi:hypothetical protein
MADLPIWMTDPQWFLVVGLEWPEDTQDMAEAAFAIAPDVALAVRPVGPDGEPVSPSASLRNLIDVGREYVDRQGHGVVFVTDLTMWLTSRGFGNYPWSGVGIDFDSAIAELNEQVGLYITISEQAHAILCSAAHQLTMITPSGQRKIQPEERERMRSAFGDRLRADWPTYIDSVVSRAA